MSKTRVAAALAACLLALLSGSPAHAATPLPVDSPPRRLEADDVLQTPSGATFEVAKGWFVTTSGGRVTLEDPDRELRVILLDLAAAGGMAAITTAWAAVEPGFDRPVRHTMTPPAREGWDEILQLVYETSTEERRTVTAVARRKAETWYVALLDAADAALDRRGAQVQTVLVSFKAPGAEEESLGGRTAHPLDAGRAAQLAEFIERSRVAMKIPGVAVAVVQDGKIVFEQGFGTGQVNDEQPVGPATLFLIGSTTKSLTTLMMARLVDDRRLEWNQPVTDLYPGFALGDSAMTRQLELRHTVCACTGLPRQDMEFLFEFGGNSPEATVESMRTMKPTTGFGETFQYSNTMVSTGGYVAARTAHPGTPLGAAYDQAMQELVFDPLGMGATTFDFARALARDHAMPHGRDLRDSVHVLPADIEKALVPVRPAGGAWSSARDLARYVQLELAQGLAPDGSRMVSAANLLRRREPEVRITDELGYGLGLFVGEDRGLAIVHHGGNTLGFTSDMFFFPDHRLGAIVLTNLGGANAFTGAVRRRLIEILFDGREEAQEGLTYAIGLRGKILAKELAEMSLELDPTWLRSLAGAYENLALGRVEIRVDDRGGLFDAGEWTSTVGRKQGSDGVVKLVLTSPPWSGFEFVPSESGKRATLVLQLSQQEYIFEKRP